mmetsp:Transcript_137403/g.293639  ORF Transcript_137403/g.293639 Transcript_137403/m.293639 type:complete len:417 (-) Transcript_137403:96-1346(-)
MAGWAAFGVAAPPDTGQGACASGVSGSGGLWDMAQAAEARAAEAHWRAARTEVAVQQSADVATAEAERRARSDAARLQVVNEELYRANGRNMRLLNHEVNELRDCQTKVRSLERANQLLERDSQLLKEVHHEEDCRARFHEMEAEWRAATEESSTLEERNKVLRKQGAENVRFRAQLRKAGDFQLRNENLEKTCAYLKEQLKDAKAEAVEGRGPPRARSPAGGGAKGKGKPSPGRRALDEVERLREELSEASKRFERTEDAMRSENARLRQELSEALERASPKRGAPFRREDGLSDTLSTLGGLAESPTSPLRGSALGSEASLGMHRPSSASNSPLAVARRAPLDSPGYTSPQQGLMVGPAGGASLVRSPGAPVAWSPSGFHHHASAPFVPSQTVTMRGAQTPPPGMPGLMRPAVF